MLHLVGIVENFVSSDINDGIDVHRYIQLPYIDKQVVEFVLTSVYMILKPLYSSPKADTVIIDIIE